MRIGLTTNYAVANAAKDADVDVIAAYPITPSTAAAEKLAEFVANGELDAEYIHVESEHSAASALVGASAMGARTFTVTASQGLVYMLEVLYIASGMRLPIVLAVATRALSAPLSIWGDMSDLMATRDAGLITFITSSAQEAYDTVIQAFRVAEDPRVHLPAIIAYDGFIMSHVLEPVELIEREEVLKYIPKKITWTVLRPEKPITMGTVGTPEYYYEFKWQQEEAMRAAKEVIREAGNEFKRMFGREYSLLEEYMVDDADYVLLAYGAHAGTARVAVEKMRKEGYRVGLVRLRVFRPFPSEELRNLLSDKVIGVLDRALSLGAPLGPVAMETRSSVEHNKVVSYAIGIGQREVRLEDLFNVIKQLDNISKGAQVPDKVIPVGLRA